nr:metallopeptidase family protein [Paramagnetospirillum kuznetsovii]
MSRVMPHHSTPPSCADLETIAAIAFADIPEELRRYAADVIIRVEDFPDDDVEREMDLESSFDLLGLYRGTAMDIQAFGGAPSDVDMIFLYRRPILDYWCETGEDLSSVVKHVLIHEIGHHFGLSDDDMERIEDEA